MSPRAPCVGLDPKTETVSLGGDICRDFDWPTGFRADPCYTPARSGA